jgi:hypothetical protein
MLDPGEGAGCGRECKRQEIFMQHNYLQSLASRNVIKHLEAFAQLTEYAAIVSGNCTK